jgi:hypothetical protein
MALIKYELRLLFTIDDKVENATEAVEDFKQEIHTGELQRKLLSEDGFSNVIATLEKK